MNTSDWNAWMLQRAVDIGALASDTKVTVRVERIPDKNAVTITMVSDHTHMISNGVSLMGFHRWTQDVKTDDQLRDRYDLVLLQIGIAVESFERQNKDMKASWGHHQSDGHACANDDCRRACAIAKTARWEEDFRRSRTMLFERAIAAREERKR